MFNKTHIVYRKKQQLSSFDTFYDYQTDFDSREPVIDCQMCIT